MLAKKITSLQHPLIKHWVQLRKTKAYREESKSLLLTGEKAILELPAGIKNLISTTPSDIPAQETYLVTEEMLKKITGLEEPGVFAAEVDLPPPQPPDRENRLLILDGIQDPGNLGTLLRTALAFGWEKVVATPGTVDFFNDKALRAAQGANFRLPYSSQTPEQIISWLRNRKASLWIADAQGQSLQNTPFSTPLALVLGSEGQGPGAWTKDLGHLISIPMQNQVESLNVAAAGAILLYTLRPS